jgi:hypothetical protein
MIGSKKALMLFSSLFAAILRSGQQLVFEWLFSE